MRIPHYYLGQASLWWAALGLVLAQPAVGLEQPASREALWKKLEPFAQPPDEFAGKLGAYRSPLKFADGSIATTPADWQRRRAEIVKTWHKRLGTWPLLIDKPTIKKLDKVERDGYTEYKVQVQASPNNQWVDGYLLIPKGRGPFPAVVVPFYEPLTSIGRGAKGRGVGTHDYGLQLVKRGFVTLSIGTPGSLDQLGGDTRDALTKAGEDLRRQPLTLLAYVAANCLTALAQLPEVDGPRIGIIGLSYGGKWSMFASCLDERFACAVWSDPGIVFNEKDSNVNYWEPWYLGYDPKTQRKPGVPSDKNPRTGLYKELIEAGEDLVDLHALMAPRPVLVSGGVQDPPKNWQALNHLVAVNTLLGHKNRAFLTARKTHVPTAPALELELAFLEYHLAFASSAAGQEQPQWTPISDAVVAQVAGSQKAPSFERETAGVAVDPMSGDVYMIVNKHGVWKSTDAGKTFARCDGGKVSGRCETAFALNVDPRGNRIACFMLDGKCAWTGDSGRTWHALADVGRNWDFAAVDWSTPKVTNIIAGLHESGGQVMLSTDGGKSWAKLFKDAEFDKTGGLGIFDARTFVYTYKGKGIQRTTDGGGTWTKVSDLEPIGRVVHVNNGTAYWLGREGLLVSKDRGATWSVHGKAVAATIGPMIDPRNPKRIAVAGLKGVFRSNDGGETWQAVASALPKGFTMPRAGWYSNVAWDPVRDIYYASMMGKATFKLTRP
jgi:dienelactone hydrolase/photosystem II stability/assembly factor-like uncharacterized protein